MDSAPKKLVTQLRAIDTQVSANPEARKYSEIWGWQAPAIDKNDLAYMARMLARRVEALDWSQAGDTAAEILEDLAGKAASVLQHNVPNLTAGPNAALSIQAYLCAVDFQVNAIMTVEQVSSVFQLPANLGRGVRVAQKRLDQATSQMEGIEGILANILKAHDAAGKLPITQSDLEEALEAVEKSRAATIRYEVSAETGANKVKEIEDRLAGVANEASGVLARVNAAYRAATSQGLAQAFSAKSKKLSDSLLVWTGVLFAGLGAAVWIARERFPAMLETLKETPNWGAVAAHGVLGLLSVAAPVWLCWVATKQIGQRFRLAEDYGYKAALATAYEGYRTEAARLDPLFEAQLFATALNRLDELPIRLIERDVAGSPFHELLTSKEFREAIDKVPELKERLVGIIRAKRPAKDEQERDKATVE